MSDTIETFETLWTYCTMNKRLAPMPPHWNTFYGMLKDVHQKPDGGCIPSLPLILAAWHDATPIAKQLRFKEHLEWADRRDQLLEVGQFLRNLKEEQWCHFGEI